ncbi:MAG: tripartite tricarboxylate transporter TctB family protein, partial [Deltaproteobacteria bacterium]|nr:tripartite tricarboxylate transporter TctB family protein [Deltaproteobacteria bacterium]
KSSIVFLFISGTVMIASLEVSLGSFSSPGSGLLPFLAALLLGIFSFINIIAVSRRAGNQNEKPIFPPAETNWRNLAVALGALVAFPFSLPVLGFNLTVFGFILFLSKTIEPSRWRRALLFALITTLCCHFLFVYWLKFVIERGIFGI